MKQIILALTILLSGCHSSTTEPVAKNPQTIISINNDSLLSLIQVTDTITIDSSANPNNKNKSARIKDTKSNSIDLIGESIGDDNWNGKPITEKVVLSQKILKKSPDTLYQLAISNYKNYESMFPRAIADNFEKGTSKEIISYPERLIFNFELFENDNSTTLYRIKTVTIRRANNGELTAE